MMIYVANPLYDAVFKYMMEDERRVNNRLEKILSVFDQSQIYPDDQRMLELDENKYADDAEMAHILHRLQSAAANPDIRNRMNAEDEFFQALEDRDTVIMQKDATIMTQKKKLEEKDASLRAAVLALSKSGMNAEMIAKTLNIPHPTFASVF
ncbi:hypothetical protein CFT61_02540 [Segatella copri]|uniref:Uncharacterized protein n=1 Tax=Segatella copri TaxID=165179 RepID=A0AA91YY66_9BACT|nr:hypothetical protein [Segatella copri]OXL45121.1 hypothetical protein CFT61_02540 [Segatella copri]